MLTRKQMWDDLGSDVDVLIIGGGITGAGIARDATRRGLKVAVVEMGDLASGRVHVRASWCMAGFVTSRVMSSASCLSR